MPAEEEAVADYELVVPGELAAAAADGQAKQYHIQMSNKMYLPDVVAGEEEEAD